MTRTWIVGMGEIANHTLLSQRDDAFMTEDGEWHPMPPLFAIRGTAEDVKARLCECIDRMSEAMDNEDSLLNQGQICLPTTTSSCKTMDQTQKNS